MVSSTGARRHETEADEIERVHARWRPVDERVAEVLAAIRGDCRELDPRKRNESNEEQVERFIARLEAECPGRSYRVERGPAESPISERDADTWRAARDRRDRPCVVIERQRLSAWAVRTTRWNYLFTVPGDADQELVLVAHYDTWRGPGADDNTTGEEILKQYLRADLAAERRPALTHTYFLAGSEECGLVGLVSQLFLTLGLQAANAALTQRNPWYLLAALATAPLAGYRFGVSGSREYVRTMSTGELARLRGVVAVDSVGEGRLYIPRGTLGADFLHVLVPFGDYDSINDLLEEGAHLHGIKYNNYLAGGTTDHVSYLEVNNGLVPRLLHALQRLRSGAAAAAPVLVPATALVAMAPGKASPIVFGGKIHTKNDTPDRVYPGPVRETLLVLDYMLYRMDGGERVGRPRHPDSGHYARLYRSDAGHLVALKDAVEPNRRNVNAVYAAEVVRDAGRVTARLGELLGWGVHTRLDQDVAELCSTLGRSWRREAVTELSVDADGVALHFSAPGGLWRPTVRLYHECVAGIQGVLRRWTFVTFFALAWLLAQLVGQGLDRAFEAWPGFARWVADNIVITIVVIVVAETALLLHLMARRIPTWIDNGYKRENRADNLASLRRVAA